MPKSNARWPNSEKKNELRNEFVLSSPEHSSNNTQKEDEKKRRRSRRIFYTFIHSIYYVLSPSSANYFLLEILMVFCSPIHWFFKTFFFSLYLFSSLSCLAFVWISMPFNYISTTKCVSIFKIFGSANFLRVLSTKQDWARFSIRC